MKLKKFYFNLTLLLLSLFIIPFNALAYSDYIIAGGENIGIKLNAKGVLIVGIYNTSNSSPAEDAGLKKGDMISSIDGWDIQNIEDMASKISQSSTGEIKIDYIRNKKKYSSILKLHKDNNGIYKTGLYVKDSITGIGTLTYIDPKTKKFGALGHEIIEQSTGKLLEIKDGKIFNSTVTGVVPSKDGNPGEKQAKYDIEKTTGTIFENTTRGVFGNYTDKIPNKQEYKVAKKDDIKTGEAKILTVLDGNNVLEYKVNIIKINNNDNKTRNFIFDITDEKLLNKTGGIIQGMSGSPIIQNDKIIGAVTHVVVDDPHKGYGIFITNMLEESEK